MPQKHVCPHCQKAMYLPDAVGAVGFRCPHCAQDFRVGLAPPAPVAGGSGIVAAEASRLPPPETTRAFLDEPNERTPTPRPPRGWRTVSIGLGLLTSAICFSLLGVWVQTIGELAMGEPAPRGTKTAAGYGRALATISGLILLLALVQFLVGRICCLFTPRSFRGQSQLASVILTFFNLFATAFGVCMVLLAFFGMQNQAQPDGKAVTEVLGELLGGLAVLVLAIAFGIAAEFCFLAYLRNVGGYLNRKALLDQVNRSTGWLVATIAIGMVGFGCLVMIRSAASPVQVPTSQEGFVEVPRQTRATEIPFVRFIPLAGAVWQTLVGISYIRLHLAGQGAFRTARPDGSPAVEERVERA